MKNVLVTKKKWFILGALLIVVAALIAVLSVKTIRDRAAKAAQATQFRTEQSKDIVAWGEVKYNVVYDISIDFPSIVTSLDVKEGDRVKLGQSLVTLDISEYKASLDKLQQQLFANEAGLKTATQDIASLEADIAQLNKDLQRKTDELSGGTNVNLKMLQDSLALAVKDAEKARQDAQSYEQLYSAGAISRDALDKYRLLADQKEKSVLDISNSIEKLKRDLQTELDQLGVSLKYKQAQLSQVTNANSANTAKQNSGVAVSRIDLDNMKSRSVKSYIKDNRIVSCVEDGIVKNIRPVIGTRLGLQNAPTSVLQLIDASSVVISAEVEEAFIKSVSLGETVKIVPEFDKGVAIQGTVSQISNIAVEDDGKRIIKVEVKPQDPEGLLKPGYTADVYFPAK